MSQGKVVLMACGSFSPPTYMHLRMFEIAKDYLHSLGLATVIGGIVSPVHDAYGKKDLVAAQHRIAMLKLALRSSSWIKISDWETQQNGWTRTRVSLQYHQDTINRHVATIDDSDGPNWLPDDILNVNNINCANSIDEPDNLMERLNGNHNERVTVKLLCGADLLESFATPGLWSDEDLETIVGRHGLVVVSRAGSDPGRFIYESDMLYKHRPSSLDYVFRFKGEIQRLQENYRIRCMTVFRNRMCGIWYERPIIWWCYQNNVTLVTNYIVNEVSSTVIRRLVRRGESAKYLTDDAVLAYLRSHRLYGATSSHTEAVARCS